MPELEQLRYPIGKFIPKDSYTNEELTQLIGAIDALPLELEKCVGNFTTSQLDTPYREGGWTVRQLIHHLADSHMNAYVRFKWTLTEITPVIKAYDEKSWAETKEVQSDPSLSLVLLKALHSKWVVLMKGLTAKELQLCFIHPETKKEIKLERMIGLYAWHSQHHLAHITSLKTRMNW